MSARTGVNLWQIDRDRHGQIDRSIYKVGCFAVFRYAELHCKTNFSFLEGAAHAHELVARARQLGYRALAITDRNSLAGVVRAHTAAKDADLKLVVGAEITPVDAPGVVLWPSDRAAYGRLSRLITVGRRRAAKGSTVLRWDDVLQHADGLLAGILPPARLTGSAARQLHVLREAFADRGYLLAEPIWGPDDAGRLDRLAAWARATRLPLVAAGGVLYDVPPRKILCDVLTAIRYGTTVDQVQERLPPNAMQHLKSLETIRACFARYPSAVRRTLEVAERCGFSLDELRYQYPQPSAPDGETPMQHLERLAWQGAHRRYPGGIPSRVRTLLKHELALIEELGYEAYFLTVWDLVCFARRRGVLCQGRGSAANSAVCYCLGITAVDPSRMDVLFERFVSRERNEAPDIDVDFEHERREEVLQYVYHKYGRRRAGIAAEVISYRPRSAVRDIGKALGLSLDRVDTLAKHLEGYRAEPDLAQRCRQCGIDPESRVGRQLIMLVEQIVGFPRHLSQHVGGMVITQDDLCELVPIENAAMPDRTVIQWDKNDLDELGILKVDCLALGMLTAIRKCFALVRRHSGHRWTLATVPPEDPRVYAMICRADTMGVFQIESRAQMSMLPRLRPRSFYDLVIEIAIVRPGPIQGNMVHPYLRRRAGREPVTYPSEAIREVLHKTLGVPLFQEQAMRLAVVAAGFTPGEADQLRRAMGAWRKPGIIDQFRQKLIEGMSRNGLSREFAGNVFRQIRGFGEYGFPESHAASFALLVYVSAWLKYTYPAAFTAALLNSQPMGFYAPAQLVADARKHGVEVRPVDVNASQWDCALEAGGPEAFVTPAAAGQPGGSQRRAGHTRPAATNGGSPRLAERGETSRWALRLGFRMVIGLSQSHCARIEQTRAAAPFASIHDFAQRTQLSRAVLQRLADADAFQSLGLDRRDALWHVLDQPPRPVDQPLFDGIRSNPPLPAQLPPLPDYQQVYADYRTVGLSLRAHPLSFFRHELDQMGITAAAQLNTYPPNHPVVVAGLVLVRQRPSTAKGITFVTLEDETGVSNLVIHTHVWKRYYTVARTAGAMVAHGRLERRAHVIHVVVDRLDDLTHRLQRLTTRSRDFH